VGLYGCIGGYTIGRPVTTWTFIWLMFLLKIPIVGLFLIVRWAVGQTPDAAAGEDGGIGKPAPPVGPRHPRTRRPRPSRRGPHRAPAPLAPARVRTVIAEHRLPRH
jgi:hypothetical protein